MNFLFQISDWVLLLHFGTCYTDGWAPSIETICNDNGGLLHMKTMDSTK